MSQERLYDLMFGIVWPPTTPLAIKQSVIDTLTELEALRGQAKGLTEDEFADWRQSILDELATNRHAESVLLTAFGCVGFIFAGGLTWAVLAGRNEWAFALGFALVLLAPFLLRCARALSAKKRLPLVERLDLVAELLARGLVTAEEAAELRTRIEQLGYEGLA
jgi:hypothetical protein